MAGVTAHFAASGDNDICASTATLSLADRFGLTVYDAAYLEVARRRGVPLATVDEALHGAGHALGVPMLGRKT